MDEEKDLWQIEKELIQYIKEKKSITLQELEDFLMKELKTEVDAEKLMRRVIKSLVSQGDIWITVKAV